MKILSPDGTKLIANLTPKADSFKFELSVWAVKVGYSVGAGTRADLIPAAVYLSRERAAVSLTCNGFTVSKI